MEKRYPDEAPRVAGPRWQGAIDAEELADKLMQVIMATVTEVADLNGLVKLIADDYRPYCVEVTPTMITVEPYGFDGRIGWDTHVVCLDGRAIGFTDGPAR